MIGNDYLRLVRVIALSYQCGFVTEEEYNQLLYNLETKLQKQYTSFEETHETYYYGEMFRLKTKDSDTSVTINDITKGIADMQSKRYYKKIDKYYLMDLKMEE